jgi:hypothetical protein
MDGQEGHSVKPFDTIALVAIALTAVLSLNAVNAEEEPQEPTQEVTTSPTIQEATEPTQQPTETQEPVTEPPEVTQPPTKPATEPEVILYDVPLSEDLQLHIIAQAESKGIDPAIVMGMIWKESRFNTWCVGDSGKSLGLMQIQPRWHSGLMAQLGCPDLHDPFQNVTVGINILGSHLARYDGNVEMALVSYNAGATGAYNKYFSKGVYSSGYSKAVLKKAEEIRSEAYVHG